MAAASTALTAATASTLHRTGGLAAERWRGAASHDPHRRIIGAMPFQHTFAGSFRDAKRVLFQHAGRICLRNLAQLQEAQATTVIGGGVDQACRAKATAVERAAHRGTLRAGRARISDPWCAWPRIGSAPAREWRKLAAGREQQSWDRGGRICLRSSTPSCESRGGFGVMAPHRAARARQSLGLLRKVLVSRTSTTKTLALLPAGLPQFGHPELVGRRCSYPLRLACGCCRGPRQHVPAIRSELFIFLT